MHGWLTNLVVSRCLIWWFASMEKSGNRWHWMSLLWQCIVKQLVIESTASNPDWAEIVFGFVSFNDIWAQRKQKQSVLCMTPMVWPYSFFAWNHQNRHHATSTAVSPVSMGHQFPWIIGPLCAFHISNIKIISPNNCLVPQEWFLE